MTSVAVVGGGITGLAAARRLSDAGLSVTVLEGSPRWGGKLAPLRLDGVRFDASHQNTRATGLVEQQADGQRRVVFPTELVQGQGAVWPPAP